MRFFLGTLTQYYSTVRPLDDPDWEVVAGAVSAWRHWVSKELPHALDWDESPTAPFETVEVGDKDWGALWLLIAYAAPDSPQPPATVAENWQDDLQILKQLGSHRHPYCQVIRPRIWLPDAADLMFRTSELNEEMTWVGSSDQLARDLVALKFRWRGELRDQPELEERLERMCDVLGQLARRSSEFRLPLRLISD
jgi:hypothetical protein